MGRPSWSVQRAGNASVSVSATSSCTAARPLVTPRPRTTPSACAISSSKEPLKAARAHHEGVHPARGRAQRAVAAHVSHVRGHPGDHVAGDERLPGGHAAADDEGGGEPCVLLRLGG